MLHLDSICALVSGILWTASVFATPPLFLAALLRQWSYAGHFRLSVSEKLLRLVIVSVLIFLISLLFFYLGGISPFVSDGWDQLAM
jgi:hypothetical protein